VSSDSADALRPRIEKLIGEAQEFRNHLDEGTLRLHYGRDAAWEMNLARALRRLVGALESLKAVKLPPSARRGVRELGRLLPALIKRWKWTRVVGPGGEKYLEKKERLRVDNERSYLAAVRSHVEAWGDGKVDRRPSENHLKLAETAETEGIAPAAPAVLREEDLKTLLKARIHRPYLAPAFPTLIPGEFEAIESAIQDLRDGSRIHDTLQPALFEECRRAEAELAEARARDPLPDPDRLTVGEMMDVLRVMEGAYALIGTSKIFFEQYHRRERLLGENPGFKAFKRWANSVLGTHPTSEAAEEFLSRLARQIQGTFEEAREMRLLDAVELLSPSRTAGLPSDLPPGGESAAAVSPVILGKPTDEPVVHGKRKPRLTAPRYKVVKALLEAGEDGLSKDSLATESGHTDAVGILKRLAESDDDWRAVILLAGVPGGRYRIRC
jgi:hypothetical protein